jgi:hypothetical protein
VFSKVPYAVTIYIYISINIHIHKNVYIYMNMNREQFGGRPVKGGEEKLGVV